MNRSLAPALLFLASPALAQTGVPIKVTGIVQPVPGPTICMQGETHFLECTSVYLKSSTVNLNAWVGQTVNVTGVDVGITCHVIDVTSVATSGVTLSWSGAATPGGTITFSCCVFGPNPPHPFFLYFSNASGFFPINLTFG